MMLLRTSSSSSRRCCSCVCSSSGSGSSDAAPTSAGSSGRRRALTAGLAAALALAVDAPQRAALAAVAGVASPPPASLTSALSRALPFPLPMAVPEPVRFPRKALDLRFAVLLMRSSYDAVDALDVVPMPSFEARFWKLRQSEQEGYLLLVSPLRPQLGQLGDPLYFDFISFAQLRTINEVLDRPERVFEEEREVCASDADDAPCESRRTVVTRPPRFADDAALPAAYFAVTGDLVYGRLRDGFRGEAFPGVPPPPPRGASAEELAAGAAALLSVMVGRGYALAADVRDVKSEPGGGASWTTVVSGPCTQWGLTALAARRARAVNLFDAAAVDAWLRAGGRVADVDVELTDAGIVETWRVQ